MPILIQIPAKFVSVQMLGTFWQIVSDIYQMGCRKAYILNGNTEWIKINLTLYKNHICHRINLSEDICGGCGESGIKISVIF